MEEEPVRPRSYSLGDDLSRMSVQELDALRQRLLVEADRVAAEMKTKDATKAAAENVFKL